MWQDFKTFLMRGNVIDLAVGFVVGVAFGAIVKSLVDDVIMPPIGLLLGKVDFSNLYVLLHEGTKAAPPYASLADAKAAGAVTLNYGAFINTVISFIIIAAVIFFFVVVPLNAFFERSQRRATTPDPTTRKCPECLSEIPMEARRCAFCTAEVTPMRAPTA